jgi:hypothetical protein
MTYGRVGKGASSRLARAMVPAPLTTEQGRLLAQYRNLVRDLERAETAVRDLNDEINMTIALLRRGVTVTRLLELLQIPSTRRSTLLARSHAGEDLLAVIPPVKRVRSKP